MDRKSDVSISRPIAGGFVALGDSDLAKIGLAVVYEAAAKSATTSALRALLSLDLANWSKLDRVQFSQLIDRLSGPVSALCDPELSIRFDELSLAVANGHDARHIIVHVAWGEGGDRFMGYDFLRQKEVTSADIDQAVERCAEIKRAAHWFALRIANLVEEGRLSEREKGPGLSIQTGTRLVRL